MFRRVSGCVCVCRLRGVAAPRPALALDGDEACLLLWDPQRPSTFGAVRRAVPSGGDEDEVLADAVRLCVAASAEDGAEVGNTCV